MPIAWSMNSRRSTPTRSARRALAALITAALAASPLGAQTLDLGPPEPPAVGYNSALADLDARLADEIGIHLERLTSARDANDDDWALASSLSIATRALARAMLADSPSLPDARAVRSLQAMKIAARAEGIDALARAYADLAFGARRPPSNDPDLIAAAADAETARAAIHAFLRAACPDPTDPSVVVPIPATAPDLDDLMVETFDELRPALAVIDDGVAGIEPAWPPTTPDTPELEGAIESLRRALAGAALTEEDRGFVERRVDALALAQRSPVHRRSARRLATGIEGALRAADTIAETPWLGDHSGGIRTHVVYTSTRLFNARTREDARRTLAELDRIGDLVGRVDSLPVGVNPEPAQRAVASVLTRTTSANADASPWESVAHHDTIDDLLGAIERVLTTIEERPALDMRDIPQPKLRRAWRLMERDEEQARNAAVDALPGIASDPRSLASPEVVSLLKKHRDATEHLRIAASLPQWQRTLRDADSAPDDAIARSVRIGVADRLKAYAEALANDRLRERVIDLVVAFEADWNRYTNLPGEQTLHERGPGVAALTGDRAEEVLAMLRNERENWLVAWAAAHLDNHALARKRLTTLEHVGRAIDVCSALSDDDALAALERWGAFEGDPVGMGEIRRMASRVCLALVEATLANDEERTRRVLGQWGNHFGAAELLARLAAETRRDDWPPLDGAAGLVAQIGSGVPDEALLVDRRVHLAQFSRWIGELGKAMAIEDQVLSRDVLDHLNELAPLILESLDDH